MHELNQTKLENVNAGSLVQWIGHYIGMHIAKAFISTLVEGEPAEARSIVGGVIGYEFGYYV